MLFQKLFIKVSYLWKYQQFGNNQYVIVALNPFFIEHLFDVRYYESILCTLSHLILSCNFNERKAL